MKILTKKLIISWSVCSLLIIIYISGSSGQCTTPGRFGGRIGAICKHVCHCAGSAECDKDTGRCINCASGYSGNTCQTQNVAFGRNAVQSSTYAFANCPAGFAVNGNTSTTLSNGHQCTHTEGKTNDWWYVDLADVYTIASLRIYNRKSLPDRLRAFTVRIGSINPQLNTLPLCFQHPNTTPAEIIDFTCASTMRGRYVRISLETRIDYLTLCEVQVFVCTDHSFGTDCNKRCHCKRETEVCDKGTGSCSSGCAAGYMGADCQTVCTDHSFDTDCNKRCHCKRETEVCDKVTGYCTSGCAAGYMDADCQTECPMNTYGDFATSCRTHCKPVTVETRQCNFISGDCTDTTGCQAGYMGSKCDQGCPMEYYGDCKTKCSTHCIAVDGGEGQCHFISGHCTDTTGCQSGYIGAKCIQACPVNYYGDCMARCSLHCIEIDVGERQCNFISGHCTKGCQAGYTGSRCDQECTDYLFGVNCAIRCNCRYVTEVCKKHNGACSSRCPNGYHGVDCQTECADDRFGENCSETCNCGAQSKGCNKATGACFACPAGFQGEKCKTECTDPFFGVWCAKRCNCMDETEACNKRTGACLSGCAAGFEGQDCKTVAAQVNGLKIAAIVIGGLLGLALIAALFVIYKQRMKYVKATQTKASLAGHLGQPTYQDLVHNIDADDAENNVASPADVVIEYEMEEGEYDNIPQLTTNERQHQQIAK